MIVLFFKFSNWFEQIEIETRIIQILPIRALCKARLDKRMHLFRPLGECLTLQICQSSGWFNLWRVLLLNRIDNTAFGSRITGGESMQGGAHAHSPFLNGCFKRFAIKGEQASTSQCTKHHR